MIFSRITLLTMVLSGCFAREISVNDFKLNELDKNSKVRLTFSQGSSFDVAMIPGKNVGFFTSNRSGNKDIYAIDFSTRVSTPITVVSSDEESPTVSSDGKFLAFSGKKNDPIGNIFYSEVEDLTSAVEKENQFIEIKRPGFSDTAPAFSLGGKYLYFLTRKVGGRYNYLAAYDLNEKKTTTFPELVCDEIISLEDQVIGCSYLGILSVFDIETKKIRSSAGSPEFKISHPDYDKSTGELVFLVRDFDTNKNGMIDFEDNPQIWTATYGSKEISLLMPYLFSTKEKIFPKLKDGRIVFSEKNGKYYDLVVSGGSREHGSLKYAKSEEHLDFLLKGAILNSKDKEVLLRSVDALNTLKPQKELSYFYENILKPYCTKVKVCSYEEVARLHQGDIKLKRILDLLLPSKEYSSNYVFRLSEAIGDYPVSIDFVKSMLKDDYQNVLKTIDLKLLYSEASKSKNTEKKYFLLLIAIDAIQNTGDTLLSLNEIRSLFNGEILLYGSFELAERYLSLAEKNGLVETAIKDILKYARRNPASTYRANLEKLVASSYIALASKARQDGNLKQERNIISKAQSLLPNSIGLIKLNISSERSGKNCDKLDDALTSGDIYRYSLDCSYKKHDNSPQAIANLYKIKSRLEDALVSASESPDIYNLMGWVLLRLHYHTNSSNEGLIESISSNFLEVFGDKEASLLEAAEFYFSASSALYEEGSRDYVLAKSNLAAVYVEENKFAQAYPLLLERIAVESLVPFVSIEEEFLYKELAGKSAYMIGQYKMSATIYAELSRISKSFGENEKTYHFSMLCGLSFYESKDFVLASNCFKDAYDSTKNLRARAFELFALSRSSGDSSLLERSESLLEQIDFNNLKDPLTRALYFESKKSFYHKALSTRKVFEVNSEIEKYLKDTRSKFLDFGYLKTDADLAELNSVIENLTLASDDAEKISLAGKACNLLRSYIESDGSNRAVISDILQIIYYSSDLLGVEAKEQIYKNLKNIYSKSEISSPELNVLFAEKAENISFDEITDSAVSILVSKKMIDRSNFIDPKNYASVSSSYADAKVSDQLGWVWLAREGRNKEAFEALSDYAAIEKSEPNFTLYFKDFEAVVNAKLATSINLKEYARAESLLLKALGVKQNANIDDNACAIVKFNGKVFLVSKDKRIDFEAKMAADCSRIVSVYKLPKLPEIGRLGHFLTYKHVESTIKPAFFNENIFGKGTGTFRHTKLDNSYNVDFSVLDLKDIRVKSGSKNQDFRRILKKQGAGSRTHICTDNITFDGILNPLSYLYASFQGSEKIFVNSMACDQKDVYENDLVFKEDFDLDDVYVLAEEASEENPALGVFAFQDLYSASVQLEDDEMALEALDQIVSMFIQLKDPVKALEFQLLKTKHYEDNPREIYAGAVNLSMRAKNWKVAEKYLREVEKNTGKDSPELLNNLMLSAILSKSSKRYKEAISFYETLGIEAKSRGRNSLLFATKESIADIYNINLANLELAKQNYIESMEGFIAEKDAAKEIGATLNLSGLLSKVGEYSQASSLIKKIENKIASAAPLDKARFYQISANTSYQLGNYLETLEALDKVKPIIEKVDDFELKQQLGLFYFNLKVLLKCDLEGPSECSEYFANNLKNFDLGNDVASSVIYSNAGYIYRISGDYIRSEKNLLKSISISKIVGDKSALANDYRNLGLTYLARKRYSSARSYLNQALGLSEELGLKYNKSWALLGLAELAYLSESKEAGDKIIKLHSEFIFSVESSKLKLAYLALKYQYGKSLSASEFISKLYDLKFLTGFSSGKSTLLLDYTSRDAAELLYKNGKSLSFNDVKKLSFLTSFRETSSDFNTGDSRSHLEMLHSKYINSKKKLSDILKAKIEGDYLHYFAGRENIYVIKLSDSDYKVAELTANLEELQKMELFLNKLLALYATSDLILEDLYGLLIEPFSREVVDAETLVINPGKSLLGIPFWQLLSDVRTKAKQKFYLSNFFGLRPKEGRVKGISVVEGKSTGSDSIAEEASFIRREFREQTSTSAKGVHFSAHGTFDKGRVNLNLMDGKRDFRSLMFENMNAHMLSFFTCDVSANSSEALNSAVSYKSYGNGGALVGSRGTPNDRSTLLMTKRFFTNLKNRSSLLSFEKALYSVKQEYSHPAYSANFTYYYVHSLFD